MVRKKQKLSTIELLEILLKQQEGAALEFKQELYKLDISGEGKKREKGELVKDITALANGNVTSIGDIAYLIIGAEDQPEDNGSRKLFDIKANGFTEIRVLDIVNAYIEPALQDLSIESVVINEKNLVVISIPSSPHLHETIKILETPKRIYPEYTVFVRQNGKVQIAPSREREALRKLKEIHFSELKNPSPIPFGIAVGAITATPLLSQVARTQMKDTTEIRIAGGIAGLITGSIFGGTTGMVYRDYKEIKADWHKVPEKRKYLAAIASALIMLIFWVFGRRILPKASKPKPEQKQ